MDKILFLDFRYDKDDKDDINPYHIIDGNWGGFGETNWFIFKNIHPNNVFERQYITWKRVWDDDKQYWRKITKNELKLLPKLKKKLKFSKKHSFDKFIMPIIKTTFPELIITQIVGIQPMQ